MPKSPNPKRRGGPKKGSPKAPGSGRKKGTSNKSTQLLKDAVLMAAELCGDKLDPTDKGHGGLVTYLEKQAVEQPVAFMALLGRILPMQIGGTGDEDELNRAGFAGGSNS